MRTSAKCPRCGVPFMHKNAIEVVFCSTCGYDRNKERALKRLKKSKHNK